MNGIKGIAAVVLSVLAGAALAGDRSAVPAKGARSGAVTALRKEFRDAYRSKDRGVKRELAGTLLERAESVKDDPVRLFVLLDEAAGAAEDARDLTLALDAVDRMAEAFDVKAAARGMAAVKAVTKGKAEAGVLAEAASASIDISGRALSDDDAGTARKAIAAAKKHSKTCKMAGLTARANALGKLVGAFGKMAAAARTAHAGLAETPDAPELHDAIGRHLCFGRGDWAAGLPYLARGARGAVRDAAASELAEGDALALADVWWTAAASERGPLGKARMLARAAQGYESVEIPADRRKEVTARLATITYTAWSGGVALTTDFSKFGPANLAIATVRGFIAKEKIETKSSAWRTKLPKFPEVRFGKGVTYFWILETNVGPMKLRFFTGTAPNHVANFVYLTELGYFDGLKFHRVIKGFMAQGGCPKGNGNGDPGYTFMGEFEGGRKHTKAGILSMANTGQPKSDGSQFFITFRETPNLNGKHTVFGELVDGEDTLKKLEENGSAGEGSPKKELKIVKARISVK
jgi:peptidyl-prolyl cis-trans isomerase B (cyclophilin B)